MLLDNDIPAGRLLNIQDCAKDPHYLARKMVMQVADPRFGEVSHPGIVPKFEGQGADISWPGAAVGAHNKDVYLNLLGLAQSELDQLIAKGIV